MGCSCKQNNQTQQKQPIMVKTNNVVEIIDLPEPPYTIEEVIRIKDYLTAMNKTDNEKEFISNILLQSFGDIIPDYCDQTCLNHIRSRAEYMQTKITEYNNTK